MSANRVADLELARTLLLAGELDLAFEIVEPWLTENPDDALALVIASSILQKAKKLPVAFHLARRASELEPERFVAWNNLGKICDDLWLVQDAERYHRKAIKCAVNAKDKAKGLNALAALLINCGEFEKAGHYCQQAVMADPTLQVARANLGFCQLAARKWVEGWENYAYCLGTEVRKRDQYKGEMPWDGTPSQRVVIYGEQGLGDEISFASMVPDAIEDCEKVILNCDKRLVGLFQRSFPKAKVYGMRTEKKLLDWADEDKDIHASAAAGSLGAFYRKTTESFPGNAYLVPDPTRVMMWKSLFATMKKPVIGVAWSGGMRHTGAKYRQWSLEEMLPLFKSIDAHWVCLKYKDAEKEIAEFRKNHGIDLVQYPFATLTKDYDDTAALVASLDRVITMQTAVAHLAGAIGKECWVFVAKTSQWRYGEVGEDVPWYKSVRVFRQKKLGEWDIPINQAAFQLKDLHAERAAA